jgi:2,4-dienoyl-CoA reductase-like NADH-dependent reductase (Old Yellow Enzyme family)
MSNLFTPISFRSINLKNRIVVSPMCQYSSEDGFANDWHLVHLGSRAIGGAGLIITEATAVSPQGRISPSDLGIWKNEHIAPFKRITSFILGHGSVPGIQLAHAGRKASCGVPWKAGKYLSRSEGGWEILAPSPIAFNEGAPIPRELTVSDIQSVISDFKKAAVRALQAGFRLIEIHAAHGYLVHEFLSPLSNQRNDDYGGSFENRIRFLTEIVNAVKEIWPSEFPIFVRISATDWVEDGWSVEDSVGLSVKLKEIGVDLVDCSSGGNISKVRIPLEPGYQVPFAKAIKHGASIPTGAVGLITSAEQAEQILKAGDADLIILARAFLRDPYFALHAAREFNVDVDWPEQYLRAK